MLNCKKLSILSIFVLMTLWLARAQDVNRQQGVINFAEPILPDPVMQHNKEVFILNGCVYCHGVDLRVRNGEAADLMHSALVGADQNGNLIGPLLRAGIPQTPKLSPMPQFADLSDAQISDIVHWIHYARQQGVYEELVQAKEVKKGDSSVGKVYFDKSCGSCHNVAKGFAQGLAKYSSSTLRKRILRPPFVDTPISFKVDQLHDKTMITARERHLWLLENYSLDDIANLVAYLQKLN